MYHPTSRVLTVLELLQSKAFISGPELAARLEVDVHTMRHYITILQDLGILVENQTGRYGGYKLQDGFKLPPLMFTNEEVLALTLGLLVARKFGLEAANTSIEAVFAKIERVLPPTLRLQVQAIQHTLTFDSQPFDVAALVSSSVLSTISIAGQQSRQLQLCYLDKTNQETQRIFDPYGVVNQAGRWYVVGYCHLRNGLRVFRLDCVRQVVITAPTFVRPPNFNPMEYVVQSFAAIPDKWTVEVLLSISLEEALRKVLATLATLEQYPSGTILRASIEDLDWMARFLIGLACPLQIFEPVELRMAFRKLAFELTEIANQQPEE